MKTLSDDYVALANSIKLHRKQDELVGEYLEKYGEVENDFLYNTGLVGCGRIKNPRQRIRELRLKGWNIKTDTDRAPGTCWYVLISRPTGPRPEGQLSML
jgi:hypothetical protein